MREIREGNVAKGPISVALAVTCEGTRDILGLWAGEHGDGVLGRAHGRWGGFVLLPEVFSSACLP
jgi:hypothetical protein